MAPPERADTPREEGVEFVHEEDGRITARDIETGVASYGETKAEALAMLVEALALHAGGGEPSETRRSSSEGSSDGGEPVDDADLREFGLDANT